MSKYFSQNFLTFLAFNTRKSIHILVRSVIARFCNGRPLTFLVKVLRF